MPGRSNNYQYIESIKLTDNDGMVYLELTPIPNDGILYSNWKGCNLSEGQIKEGSLHGIDLVKQYGLTKTINDNRQVIGVWDQAMDWVENVHFPKMTAAGLKKFAHVVSPDVFANLSAAIFSSKAKRILDIKLCQSYEEAVKWLKENSH